MKTVTETHEGVAVEFYFDANTEANVRAYRDSIYEKGIKPVLGEMNDRPHISLAVFGKTDNDKLINLTERFSKNIGEFEIKLGAIGIFPTPDNVLFLIPVPNCIFLDIHRAYHTELINAGLTSSQYYLPGNWVPHCTVEFDLSDSQLRKAVHLSKEIFKPLCGSMSEIGVVAFRPINYLADFALTKKD